MFPSGHWTRRDSPASQTDNEANIVAAARNLGWQWLDCFGHNRHLAVTNALTAEKDHTARAMDLCRILLMTFS